MSDYRKSLNGGLSWLERAALPLWAEVGYCSKDGSFVERLTLSAEPLTSFPRRSMTQARQIFVFAKAAKNGWLSGAPAMVERAWQSLVARYWHGGDRSGWVYQCDQYGNVLNSTRDFYAQAFCLLAAASSYHIVEDKGMLDIADDTLAFMDKCMASQYGGYVESWPDATLPRRQNPHMHLLEALLELHEADASRGYLDRATNIVDLFRRRFLQANGGCLGEYFEVDFSPKNPFLSFEPGHHFEWVWLLSRYGVAAGTDLSDIWLPLLRAGARGFNAKGLLVDEYSTYGKVVNSSTRLWPLTEAVKALTICDNIVPYKAGSCWSALQSQFLADAPLGGWHDHFAEDGTLLVDFIPASSLYHICCAMDLVFGVEQ